MMLPSVRRPSITPSRSTARSRSSRMRSAASFATSTAPSTEMPTSAACSAGASLMPSPRKPTTCLRRLSARMMRFFCAGVTRQNSAVSSTRASSAGSSISWICDAGQDAADRQAELATDVLRRPARCRPSPSSRRCRARRGCAAPRRALSLGGSRKAAKPANTSSLSSLFAIELQAWGRGFEAIPSTRNPSRAQRLEARRQARPRARRRAAARSGRRLRSRDDSRRMSSNAPLMTSNGEPLRSCRPARRRSGARSRTGSRRPSPKPRHVHLLVRRIASSSGLLQARLRSGC